MLSRLALLTAAGRPSPSQAARSSGLRKGMLGYGGRGKDSRTSHMWVLRRDSAHLGKASWETPFAEVVAGLDELLQITEVGDMAPWGDGPSTSRIDADPTFHEAASFPGEYLRQHYPAIDYWTSCALQQNSGGGGS